MAELADHDRLMSLVELLSPEARARLGQRLDDRFHEITGTAHERTTMPDPREIAEHMIRDAAEGITYQQIWQHVTDRNPDGALSGAQRQALTREIDDLISKATVTVTFPGSPGRKFTIGEADDQPPYDPEANICVGCPGCHTGGRCIDDPADPDDDPEGEADHG